MTEEELKEIGYDLIYMLSQAIPESQLYDLNSNGCYQCLEFQQGSVQFTKWRDGTMPFYLVIFDSDGKYIFELDLSVLVDTEEGYCWNLKRPSNELSRNVLEDLLGEMVSFDQEYTEFVSEQKELLKSGVNTPRQGYLFLNNCDWDGVCQKLCNLVKEVIERHSGEKMPINSVELEQAEDDNLDNIQRIAKRIRKGQRKFRMNLLRLYKGKCVISGWGPPEVLDAAHIWRHSISGINHVDNGILLRSDLHDLFDTNLLRINPKSFKVVISASLRGTSYWRFNGKKLRKRTDGQYPSQEYLTKIWSN